MVDVFRSYKLDVSEKFPDCSLRHGQGTQGVSSPFSEVTVAGISHFIPDKSFSSSSFLLTGLLRRHGPSKASARQKGTEGQLLEVNRCGRRSGQRDGSLHGDPAG